MLTDCSQNRDEVRNRRSHMGLLPGEQVGVPIQCKTHRRMSKSLLNDLRMRT